MEKQKQRKKPQGWYRWAILAFFLLCLTVALWLSLFDKKEESSYLRGNCWGSSLQEVRKREGGPFTYDPTTGTLTLEVSDQPGLELSLIHIFPRTVFADEPHDAALREVERNIFQCKAVILLAQVLYTNGIGHNYSPLLSTSNISWSSSMAVSYTHLRKDLCPAF